MVIYNADLDRHADVDEGNYFGVLHTRKYLFGFVFCHFEIILSRHSDRTHTRRGASLALGQASDFPGASEVILENMGKIDSNRVTLQSVCIIIRQHCMLGFERCHKMENYFLLSFLIIKHCSYLVALMTHIMVCFAVDFHVRTLRGYILCGVPVCMLP